MHLRQKKPPNNQGKKSMVLVFSAISLVVDGDQHVLGMKLERQVCKVYMEERSDEPLLFL